MADSLFPSRIRHTADMAAGSASARMPGSCTIGWPGGRLGRQGGRDAAARMFFNSLDFVIFYVVVFAAVAALRTRLRARNVLLLVASYYFYGCWDYRFLGLIVVSTLVDYFCGLWFDVTELDRAQPPERTGKDRLVLLASLVTNLGLLGFFKYYDFFVTSFADLLTGLGVGANLHTLNIILPVGISFYTFQTLSYTIDLYRGDVRTERSLLNFAVYVAFFPQLVAGPIERARRLLPQIAKTQPMTWERIWTGVHLMAWGMFKKVVIADNIALVADAVYGSDSPSGLWVAVGTYAFALQIYCDFSGYTDIARGAARVLGFDLMINFDLPYFAVNPSDFWRRWHISLSTWLRDYLYIPLGGNRFGVYRTYVNLMVTMILGGLWHGAAWNFVLWGLYHGSLLAVHRALQPVLQRWFSPKHALWVAVWFWVRVVVFFQFTCIGWLLFRAESLSQVFEMLTALATDWSLYPVAVGPVHPLIVAGCFSLFGVVQLLQWLKQDVEFVMRWPAFARTLVYVAGILGFIWFGQFNGGAFIYFQF